MRDFPPMAITIAAIILIVFGATGICRLTLEAYRQMVDRAGEIEPPRMNCELGEHVQRERIGTGVWFYWCAGGSDGR